MFNSESLKVMTNWCWNWYHISPVSRWDATSEAQLLILFPSFNLLSMQLQWARSTILYAIPCKGTTIWTPVSQRYVDFPPSNYWGRSCLNSSYNHVLIKQTYLCNDALAVYLFFPTTNLFGTWVCRKYGNHFGNWSEVLCFTHSYNITHSNNINSLGCHG